MQADIIKVKQIIKNLLLNIHDENNGKNIVEKFKILGQKLKVCSKVELLVQTVGQTFSKIQNLSMELFLNIHSKTRPSTLCENVTPLCIG